MSKWRGIEEFVAVASTGSFRAAADSLDQSTSQVSRAVMSLENRLKAALFFRSTRKVTLTDAGRSLLENCRQLVQDRDDALAMVGSSETPQGELRMTCSIALGERFIAPVVRRYAEDFPDLTVSFELSNRLIDLVAEGFDLAIRTGFLEDSRLTSSKIGERQILACAAPSYLKDSGNPEIITDLGEHNCLIGTSTTWRFQANGEEIIWKPRGRWRCNSGAAVLDAALSGMGICQLPEFYLLEHIEAGRLIPVLADYQPEAEPIWAVYPQRRHRLAKVYQLVDRLRDELKA